MSNSFSLKFYFRLLVFLSVALYVGSFFFSYFESGFYSSEITDLMTWSTYGAAFSRDVLIYLTFGSLIAYGIVCIGLIYFKPWARECFLLLILVLFFMTFTFGINILTAASSAYFQLMNIIDGFIIAIIYFSPLRNEFKLTHNNGMQSGTAEPRR